MANKQKLQGLLGAQAPIQRGAAFSVSGDAASAPVPVETTTIQKGAAFTVSTADDVDAPLPAAVLALRDELQTIARQYIGARRRSGKALLEAARWLSEARAAAEHGEWYDFLAATETTADTAERLQRIYDRAMQHPAFAAAVADGRINQSAAERLARDSTPVAVIDVVLTAEKPPTVAEVDRAIRAARRLPASEGGDGQIPQIAGFEEGGDGQIPQFAGFEEEATSTVSPLQQLREAAAMLTSLAANPASIPPGEEAEQILGRIEQALAVIHSSLRARSSALDE